MSYLNPSVGDARRNKLVIGSLSVLVTSIIAVGFLVESRWGYSKPVERLIFVSSWDEGRTRDDALKARAQEKAQLAVKLTESRRYIASLPPGKARTEAQAQYDRYLAAPNKDRIG